MIIKYIKKWKKKINDKIDKHKKNINEYNGQVSECIDKYKEEGKKCIEDLKHKDTFYKQIPNLLTISRPLGMIPANILFFTGNTIPAIVLTGVLFITDFFDGMVARKYNIVSKFGADLDAVCDKIMFLGMVLPLLISNPLMIINVLLEAVIAGVNIFGRMKGLDTKTIYVGKVKTWFLSLTLGLGYLTYLFSIPNGLLKLFVWFTSVFQGVSLCEYIGKYHELKNEKCNNKISLEDEVVFEKLDEKEQDNLLEQLKKERRFILSMQEPSKVYTGKKRVRMMMKENKNN